MEVQGGKSPRPGRAAEETGKKTSGGRRWEPPVIHSLNVFTLRVRPEGKVWEKILLLHREDACLFGWSSIGAARGDASYRSMTEGEVIRPFGIFSRSPRRGKKKTTE